MEGRDGMILVAGATGLQGGAVARRLLAQGRQVRALTRNPTSAVARKLEAAGAELVSGEMADPRRMADLCTGAAGVFSVQNFWTSSYDEEIRQGTNLAQAAAKAGVAHFVYSSAGGAERRTGIAHFESKWRIEQRIGELGLPATILRPATFMDNFLAPDFLKRIRKGKLPFPLRADRPLQFIAVEDIGAFAALAFEHPDEWIGKILEIAGDELTMPQAAEILARAMSLPVKHQALPLWLARLFMGKEMTDMFRWFNKAGFEADLPQLRALHPDLMTLQEWAPRQSWK